MDSWRITIAREFIVNLREQPVSGTPIQTNNGVWLHPLQQIVDSHRSHGRITILCPFGWVNDQGEQVLFSGLNPKEQKFFEAYKLKMKALAEHFKHQPNVWIEVWNKPFHWNNENNYSDEL